MKGGVQNVATARHSAPGYLNKTVQLTSFEFKHSLNLTGLTKTKFVSHKQTQIHSLTDERFFDLSSQSPVSCNIYDGKNGICPQIQFAK